MADTTTNESILLEIKINSTQYQAEQRLIRDSLGQVALDLEKTRAAQRALNKARDDGKVGDAEYATQSVKLREQLRGQVADQRQLEKGLQLSQQAYNAAAGSADQLKAQLFELRTAYYAMGEAERKSTEGQALQKQVFAVNQALLDIELKTGSAGRNVGNYAAAYKQGLVGIVAELVKVAAAQKSVDADSEQGQRLQQQRIGFLTAAQRTAAQSGITDFAQAQAAIDQYAQALTPAAENLVRLQQEQQQMGATAGEASQEYQQLGFKIAGAEKSLADLVAAQQAAGQATQQSGQAAQEQGQAVQLAANSLGGLRQQLIALKEQREALDPTTKEAQELNTTILELDTRIQQAAGKVDAFGERIQKNIKKENFDTVNDAIQGLIGTTTVATVVFGDNANAAAAQAKVMQLMAIAQSARSIAIGIDSAKDAAQIVLLKAKSLFLKEQTATTAAATASTSAHAVATGADAAALEAQAGAATLAAEAQVAGTEAAVAGTVAGEAQAAVTGGLTLATEAATVAAEGFAAAFALTGIGTVIVLLAALVAGLFAYSKASDGTKAKVDKFIETLFRYTTPIGLAITGTQKLYERFALVRKVLDPAIDGFKFLASSVSNGAHAFAEWAGLADTAAEKALKLAQAQLELREAQKEQFDAELKTMELNGAAADKLAMDKQRRIAQEIALNQEANRQYEIVNKKQLTRIDAELKAGKKRVSDLSKGDREIFEGRAKGEQAVRALYNETLALGNERAERERAQRQQEAKDVQTNAQAAVAALQVRIERQDAAELAAQRRRLARLDLALAYVQQNTLDEVVLQQKKVQLQADIEIRGTQQQLDQKTRLRAAGYAVELKSLNDQEAQAVQQFGLTELQKKEIREDFARQRAELDTKYDLSAARQAAAAIPGIQLQAQQAKLKLSEAFLREQHAAELNLAVEQTRAQVEQAREGSQQRFDLERRLIDQEEQLALAGLNRRTMSEAEYQAKVTAITADAVAKRKALGQSLTDTVIHQLEQEQQGSELNQQLMLAGKSQARQVDIRASQAYHNELLRAETERHAAALLATEAGTKARENVEKQHALNLRNIEAETAQAQVQLVAQKYEQITQAVSQSLAAISTIQDAASQQQLARIQQEENAITTSATRKAVLAKQQQRIEKEQHERQQKYALAQAVIDGGSAIMRIIATSTYADFGVSAGIEVALAALTTAAQIRAISAQKFSTGGLVFGPGGPKDDQVPAWLSNGEAVMSAGAVRKHGRLLSRLNVDGGGRAFYTDPLEGSALMLRLAQGGIVSSSAMYLPQVRTGGVVQQIAPAAAIDYDLLVAKLTPAFVAAAQALPPPETNLVELRQRVKELDKRDTETDI